MTTLLEQAKKAHELDDHSEAVVTSGSLPAEGSCPVRFIGYVELGVQDQKAFQGKKKDPAEKVRFLFECSGPNNIKEIERDGKTVEAGCLVQFDLKKSLNSKAPFYKMFKSMAAGRDIKHMAEMLDEVFIATVFHSEYEKDGQKKKGASFRDIANESYDVAIKSPIFTNPATGEEVRVEAIPASVDHQLFLFDNPTVEQWESIYIDGTYKAKDDTEHSKNFVQDTIENSKNWEGSPMQLLLAGLLDDDEAEEPKEAETEEPKKTKKTSKKATKDEATEQANAELAALGLA